MPTISVIIPTYNRKEWLQEAIDSVLAQRSVSLECIVVDDGSTDGTGEAVNTRYGGRIRYVYQANAGESAARNHGAALAAGDYLAFLDSDDIWLPDKLARQLDAIQSDPQAGCVACLASAMDEKGKPIWRLPYGYHIPSNVSLEYALRNGVTATGSTLLFRRTVFNEMGGYATHVRYGEDFDMALRLLLAGKKILFVRQILAAVRSHGSSQSLHLGESKILASMQDHQSILDLVQACNHDPAIDAIIETKRIDYLARTAVFYIITGQTERASALLEQVKSASTASVDWFDVFDHQLAYFTPLIHRSDPRPAAVLQIHDQVYHYRDQMLGGTRSQADALHRLHAVVWCAEQDSRAFMPALKMAVQIACRHPRLLISKEFAKSIIRLFAGKLLVRLYYLKEKLRG